ncbi:MAG: tryptophan synthase subunit alpha [Deferribacteres bacterium]|nr:tryptophan synthase subunit alpha [candidate division KSB1 bacterium]MCB9501815.1 tryptophan synthase subunit alpha [Deferribacteres bacterium]
MNNLRGTLEAKRTKNRKILSIYLTAGYPDLQATVPLLKAIVDAGADLIELGVPFSDPQADGPVIQEASHKALEAGTTVGAIFPILKEFRRYSSVPVILMGYANPFMKYGWQRIVKDAAEAGANGFIIPDLPPEESDEFAVLCHDAGLDLIFLVSPVTTPERIEKINELTTGFIYAVSITGVTGVRQSLPPATHAFLKRLRQQTSHPALVGFGVANAESAQILAEESDGVIIGSAIIRRISEAESTQEACTSVGSFIREIRSALGENE